MRVVRSTEAGMGKSLYVRRLVDRLSCFAKDPKVTICIHGPEVSVDDIMEKLLLTSNKLVIHIDIAQEVNERSRKG